MDFMEFSAKTVSDAITEACPKIIFIKKKKKNKKKKLCRGDFLWAE